MTRGERLFVILGKVCGVDLLDGTAKPLDLVGDIHRAGKLGPSGPELRKPAPLGGIRPQIDLPVTVKRIALEVLVDKRAAVIGAVYVNKPVAKRPKGLHRRCRIVYPHAAASGGGDHPAHKQHSALARRQPLLVKKRIGIARVELRLYAGLLAPVADRACVRPRAKRKRERPHEHALAGARLAGYHGQSAAKRSLGMFDDGQIIDFQTFQHSIRENARFT